MRNHNMNRRDFIKQSAGAMAAAMTLSGRSIAQDFPHAATKRTLGRTGLTTSYLGMGTGTKAWNQSSAQNRQGHDAFVKTLIHAYERGLRYYDLADMYGAHNYVRDAMRQVRMPREELMLLTKSVAKDADTMKSDLEKFRRDLDTDYLDIVLLHCLTDAAWIEKMQPCMDVLAEAKEAGHVRAVGVSCHSIEALRLAAESPWVDIMLSRVNPYGVKMDAAPEEVLPVLKKAHDSGKGMLGMKILGEGEIADKRRDSLQFVMSLEYIDAITIGFLNPAEIDDIIQEIEALQSGQSSG